MYRLLVQGEERLAQVPKFTKIQELIYELPIERVMKKGVVKVSPDTSMTELKEVLRLNRISGVPVLEGERLVGVISIEDLIKALVEGDIQAPVKKRMTTRLITVRESESVVEAVKKFAQYKVGRLLVVNEQGHLRGILTGGDITRGLLETISLDYHAEEISRYRAKHIFEDIVSDQTSLILRYKVKAKDFKKAGNASSKLKRALDRLGGVPEVIRRVAISAYEAEMNLIIHADEGGELTAETAARGDSDHGHRSWTRYPECGPGHEPGIFDGSQLDSRAGIWCGDGSDEYQEMLPIP